MRAALVVAIGLVVTACYVGVGGGVGTPADAPPPATSSDQTAPSQPVPPTDDAGIAPSPGDVAI
jgi:hypothetical protein